jgi:histidyl-tRNA synthetase
MIKALGLKTYKIRIGHVGVLRKMLADAKVPQERSAEVLQKLDKKLYDEARVLFNSMGIDDVTADGIFKITEAVGGKEVLDLISEEAGSYLRELVDILAAMNVSEVEIDLGVVRGLDYYTGMVFEAEAPSLGAEKQICGGGSYSLSELFGGEKVFSTGFAIGFDRILLAMGKESQKYDCEGIDAYVVPVSDDVRQDAAKIVSMLRSNGIASDIDIMRRKMAKAMKQASAVGAKFAIIVGKNELNENSVTVRDMNTGDQKLVKLNDLVKTFKV